MQEEPAVFVQDKWQPLSNLTIQAGLRWEAQIQPDPITPVDEVFYEEFIGKTSNGQEFPSDGTMPSDKNMWQPRIGITWDPTKDGKTVVRANAGIYNARVAGLSFASTRSTNGSRGQSIYRDSSLTGILGPVPAYPNLVPTSSVGTPFRPDIYVTAKDFRNPQTLAASVGVEREFFKEFGFLLKYNYAKTKYLTRFINRNDALLGSPWTTGLNGGPNGVSTLTTVESSAKSEYNGVTLGLNKRWSHNYQFQINYTLSWDRSDDDNERDPFTFRYAKVTDLGAEWGYSDRDQRHRLNSIFVWKGPGDVNFNFRYAYRSAQPKSITATGADANTPQDRINADGSVTQRNLGRKDNQFSSLDIRLSRPFGLGCGPGRADHRVLQRLQLEEPQEARDDEPHLQLRRDGAERTRRRAPGAARPARHLLSRGGRGSRAC